MADIQLKNGIQLPENAIKFFVSAPIDNGIEPKVPISFVQYDTGLIVVAFNILKDNQIYVPPSDSKIFVRMNKPDGHGVYIESLGFDDSGTVYFIVPQQMTTAYGTGELSLEVNTTEGQKNTKTVPVYISKNPIQDEQIKSTDDFKALYDILIYVMSVEALINQNQDALTFIKKNSSQLTTLFGITEEIVICANNSDSIVTTAQNISSVNTVSTNISDVKNVFDNIETIKKVSDNEDNINNVANNKANIDTVSGNINNVNNVSLNINTIKAVDSNKENINNVANNKENIDTVSENMSKITNVDSNITTIVSVNDNIQTIKNVDGNKTNINTVSTNIEDVISVSSNIENINSVNDNKANINTVATNINNINSVNNNKANINTVATNITSVNNVSTNIKSVNNVNTNMNNINSAVENMAYIKDAPKQAQDAKDSAVLSESWAVGGTGTRDGEDANNAKYWAEQAAAINSGYLGVYGDEDSLKEQYPTSESGKFALVQSTNSIWYWNSSKNSWIDTKSGIFTSVLLKITTDSWTSQNGIYKKDFSVPSCTNNTLITNIEIAKNNGTAINLSDIDLASTIFDYAETSNGKITLYAKQIPSTPISLYFSLSEL